MCESQSKQGAAQTEPTEEGASALGGEKGRQARCCWMLLDAVGLVTLYPSIPSCTRTCNRADAGHHCDRLNVHLRTFQKIHL